MTYKELLEIIEEEKAIYISRNIFQRLTHQKQYMIWKYLDCFRKAQFWGKESNCRTLKAKILRALYLRKKNVFGEKTGIEIANHCQLGRRICISHGGVVINANIGDDCVLHGNIILGNKGVGKESQMPTLGNGVDVGAGAVIIGHINIADNCVVGAGSVVVKSVEREGAVVAGVPAVLMESKNVL